MACRAVGLLHAACKSATTLLASKPASNSLAHASTPGPSKLGNSASSMDPVTPYSVPEPAQLRHAVTPNCRPRRRTGSQRSPLARDDNTSAASSSRNASRSSRSIARPDHAGAASARSLPLPPHPFSNATGQLVVGLTAPTGDTSWVSRPSTRVRQEPSARAATTDQASAKREPGSAKPFTEAAVILNNGSMVWRKIEAGRDHLLQYTKRPPVEALAELVWNSLDAEADLVEIEIDINSLGPSSREHSFVTQVRIKDNGHGMTPDIADRAFPKLGDSWKLGLNKRTANNLRILHGSQGRGRFFAYSIGHRARWSSVYVNENIYHGLEVSGNSDEIDGFQIEDLGEVQADKTGTEVRINVGQGRPHPTLLRDDLHLLIIAKFAPHLLGNPDIQVHLNGRSLDVLALMDGEPVDVPLDIAPTELGGHEQPILTIVDWTDEMKESPGLVLCTAEGASLVEVPKTSPPGNVRSTAYVRWSGWDAPGVADLHVIHMQHPIIVDSAKELLSKHVQERTGTIASTIVAVLREENAYPYPDEASDPIQAAERQIFDLVAVTARTPLSKVSRSQRKMTAQLLQLALQERPESLDLILAEALALSPTERDELADLLKHSTLTSIFGAAAEVSKRLDLLMTLRHVIYTPGGLFRVGTNRLVATACQS